MEGVLGESRVQGRIYTVPVDRRPALPTRNGGKLGATWDGEGTDFALFSAHATGVSLVLIDAAGDQTEYALERRGDTWSGYVPGVGPGQHYGYRADGLWDPARGLRFNPAKLLIDPYAHAVDGEVKKDPSIYGSSPTPDGHEEANRLDNADAVPHSVVIDDRFDWTGDVRPVPTNRDLIYEVHVKGFSQTNDAIPTRLRGTYLGLAHGVSTSHLRRNKVGCVELLPVHYFADHPKSVEQGLGNYWGYNPVAFLAPASKYSSARDPQGVVNEFKTMVRELHKQGLAVILDVVYNHSGEGGSPGLALSFRGIDNQAYYRLQPGDRSKDLDLSGCGNTLDLSDPDVMRLVLDSMRYWVTEMHVDGFRCDEAPILGREADARFSRRAAFFQALHADPVLSRVRIIAEPFDVSPSQDFWHPGDFPIDWSEWNSEYRDQVRDFWRGAADNVSNLAYRISGSSDMFQASGRSPQDSINFIDCHDGFTLADIVSHNDKHNLENGEDNRDGTNDNHSCNYGVEGPTDDPRINALRSRQQRNMLATLFLSQGTPMVLHGDELGRTQRGNNNAYNQDNEISWIDWSHIDDGLQQFFERLSAFRANHPALRRERFLEGRARTGSPDCLWIGPNGREFSDPDFTRWGGQSLGLLLNGEATGLRDRLGNPINDDTLLCLFHSGQSTIPWKLPAEWASRWEVVLDTAVPEAEEGARTVAAGDDLVISGPSVVVLRAIR